MHHISFKSIVNFQKLAARQVLFEYNTDSLILCTCCRVCVFAVPVTVCVCTVSPSRFFKVAPYVPSLKLLHIYTLWPSETT